MTREEYIAFRQTGTFFFSLLYQYYLDLRDRDKELIDESTFELHMKQYFFDGRMVASGKQNKMINDVTGYFDRKFHVHILTNKQNQVIKIY